MVIYIRILLLSVLIVSGCYLGRLEATPTDSDYAVYSVYLNSFPFYKNVPSAKTIILNDSTAMDPREIHPEMTWAMVAGRGDRCQYLNDTVSCRKVHKPGWEPIFENFRQFSLGKQEYLIPANFTVRYPIQLLSQFSKESFPEQQDGKKAHYIVRLSKISYNTDKTKALFFVSFICGGKCGRGELVALENVENTWQLIDTFRFWIA